MKDPDRTTGSVTVRIPDVRIWSPEDPFLYSVSVTIGDERRTLDHYVLETGVRTISANNKQILLNGEPIFLKGFGKHEDFPVFGRGTAYPVMVKNYAHYLRSRWTNSNN